jgi:predicted DNA-binding WGR domain protein
MRRVGNMSFVRMESVDPERNRHRFYVTVWQPTLWNTWALVCRWGRIGEEPRGMRVNECMDQDEALQHAAEVIELRMRHRYVVK